MRPSRRLLLTLWDISPNREYPFRLPTKLKIAVARATCEKILDGSIRPSEGAYKVWRDSVFKPGSNELSEEHRYNFAEFDWLSDLWSSCDSEAERKQYAAQIFELSKRFLRDCRKGDLSYWVRSPQFLKAINLHH
jgi:hypothetical protein